MTAIKAVQFEVNYSEDEELGWVKGNPDINLAEVIQAFTSKHEPIRKYLCAGVGLELQNLDSMVAESTINHFNQLGIPILCIHDSFLIENKHSNDLVQVMNYSFKDIISSHTSTSVDIEALVKLKTWYDTLMKYE